jgi:uncharacterized membrane protein
MWALYLLESKARKMKIETDPSKNEEQLERLRSFSANNMLIFRKGFWYFLGSVFVAASILMFAGVLKISTGQPQSMEALISFLIGVVIVVIPIILSKLFGKVSTYKPKSNQGDEWLK